MAPREKAGTGDDDIDAALAAIEALRVARCVSAPMKKRKQVRLLVTDAERNRLAEVADRQGLNSQQLVHAALQAYLEQTSREYGSCSCLAEKKR